MTMIIHASLTLCLVLAAFEDAWRYRISNGLSLALVGLFVMAAGVQGFRIYWFDHVTAALLIFVLGVPMFARGWLGGGDVKLLTAVALWCGLRELPMLLLLTSIAGGLLMLALVAIRRVVRLRKDSERHRCKEPIPYGIAISIAAIVTLWPQLL